MIPALGAVPDQEGVRFSVWTTSARRVEVRLFFDGSTALRTAPLFPARSGVQEGGLRDPLQDGLFETHLAGASAGTFYKFVLDGVEQVDPYARFLPFGVDGPAEVMALADPSQVSAAIPIPLSKAVIYELHLGTFTAAGTYLAAIEKLPALAELGVTTLELMPLSAFPGARGWGYDGVAHFAPYAGYGRPEDLRRLVGAAHRLGLSVLLDVVYNHFGPHGNALGAYAPEYFVAARDTPWGAGPNFSHPRMRSYVVENARYWLEQFGFDGLRLDATHEIRDPSPTHILRELRTVASSLDSPRLLVAEDDRNEPGLVLETGLDGLWVDDFHHQIQVLLGGDRDGYYAAYQPSVEALAETLRQGWTYRGQLYPPWNRPRGRPAGALRLEQLIYCLQNHDQIGNRALGTRLSDDAPRAAVHLATTLLFFLPMTPLLFMGQEWSASTPFLYFTDHDSELGPLISAGRRQEFARFEAFASEELRRRIPDPQARETFERSKLRWEERDREPHRLTLELVRWLLQLRREDPVLSQPCRRVDLTAEAQGSLLRVERRGAAGARLLLANFAAEPVAFDGARLGQPIFSSGRARPEAVVDGWTALIFSGRRG